MFLEGGHIYVYRSYGIHWCLNLVTGKHGDGEVLLVRALEPQVGVEQMRQRRPGIEDRRLCSGPGNLTRSLGITDAQNGKLLGGEIVLKDGPQSADVIAGPRIGLTRALERNWRFCDAQSKYLSRPARGVPVKQVELPRVVR
jgi:DNA-3-methyladenine glycosylase